MGFFEWWMERKNPGPQGQAQVSKDQTPLGQWPLWVQVLVVVVGLVAWVMLVYGLLQWEPLSALKFALAFVVYLVLSFFVHPSPAARNMGWMGGLVDNPFRFSDDVNRFLLFFQAFLFPGKIMLWSLRIIWSWVR